MKLLIADDEQNVRKGLLSLNWGSIGITEVTAVSNGAEALEIIRSGKTDVIISDIRMPALTGIELAEYIQAHSLSIAVILLTGFSDFEYAQRAIKSRVYDYLLKPLKPEIILQTVSQTCRRLKEERYAEQFIQTYSSADEPPDYSEKLALYFNYCNLNTIKIVKELGSHYMDHISLQEEADKHHFSAAYLSRMVRKETGFSFISLLNSVRLTAAVQLMSDETVKIADIYSKTGFTDQKYFSQVFRRVFGKSPSEYRKENLQQTVRIEEVLQLMKNSERET